MAISRCTVSGPIFAPDGRPVVNATVRFTLSGMDYEGGTVVVPGTVSVRTDAVGDFSVGLWPNSRGIKDTYYTVMAAGLESWRVVVPAAATAEFALLLGQEIGEQ